MKDKSFSATLMTFGVPSKDGSVFVMNELSKAAMQKFVDRVKEQGVPMEITIPERLNTQEEIVKRYGQIELARVAGMIIDADYMVDEEARTAVLTGKVVPKGPFKKEIIKLLARKADFSFSPRIWANRRQETPAVEVSDILTFDFAGATVPTMQPVFK